jgi:release factor glutamine methyltransferase
LTAGVRRADARRRLAHAGFIAADHEAELLEAAAAGDDAALGAMLDRRLQGEPLAWIIGRATFCGLSIRVAPGVYVPRPHSELLVRRAVDRLPIGGVAVDVCTGSGALALAVLHARPDGRMAACDVDAAAVACAVGNGVDAHQGDLLDALPSDVRGLVDVIVGVAPYVPTRALPLLQRDTFAFERTVPYDGGADGLGVLDRIADAARAVLRPGGALLLELGGDQATVFTEHLAALGYVDAATLLDEDGDARGIEATWSGTVGA